MEKEIINRYLINFRRLFSPFLKKDVSMNISAYPYANGAIMVIELDYNSSNNTIFVEDSSTMAEAMERTNLFDSPEQASPILSTKIIIQQDKVVIIKGDDEHLWTDKSAKNDVDNILSSLTDRKNG